MLNNGAARDFIQSCIDGNLEEVENAIRSLPSEGMKTVYYTALCCAAYDGHLPVLNRLLEIDDVKNDISFLNGALRSGCGNGRLHVVNRLLEIDAVRDNATMIDNLALSCAASNSYLAVVRRLLKIDAVREMARINLNVNFGTVDKVEQQINILINHLGEKHPKLKERNDRYNEALALCYAYRRFRRHRIANSPLWQTSKDVISLIANKVLASPPPELPNQIKRSM